jgi:hypothetical protein
VLQRVVEFAALSISGLTESSVTLVQARDAHTAACTGGFA